MPRRQIEYQDGEEVTENHKKHLDMANRILTAILGGNAANKEDFAVRFFETVAPYIPVARVEQLFPQVARVVQPPQQVQPGQQVARIEQPAQAQVPVRIEQVLQPVAQAQQHQLPQVARVEQPPPVQQVDPPVGQAEPVVRVGQPGVVAQLVPPHYPMFPPFYPGFNPVQLPRPDVYEGSPDLSVFKNRYEAYARQYNWDLIQQAASIRLYLRGRAAEIYDKLPQADRCSIEKVWTTFAKCFTPTETEWLSRLDSLLPSPNQSTRDFAMKLADHYDKANPKADPSQRNRDLKNRLKSLIPETQQSLFLMTTIDKTWEESVEMIAASLPILNEKDRGESPVNSVNINSISSKQYNNSNNNFNNRQERTEQQSSSRPQTRSGFRHEPNQYRSRSHTIHPNNRTQTDKPKTTTMTSIICMRCQKPGHYARDCRAPAPVQASFGTRNASSSNRRNDAAPRRV